ncbi:hypothetical protein SPD48_14460 [Pseudogracilibacillus sp. SE30717A]|uniref:hypothetical protein n=1 Tax=Pseudogracilibacillus sp. SE30717A TaxID=3098293 RepID=UPI00300E1E59
MIKYIRRRGGKDGNFYVYGRQPAEDFRERVGGIKALDVPKQLRNIKHLQHVIIRRQSAGSHEAFIEQQRKERRDDKIISIYGNLGSIGSEQDDEYEIEDHGRYETESREEYGYLIGDYYD